MNRSNEKFGKCKTAKTKYLRNVSSNSPLRMMQTVRDVPKKSSIPSTSAQIELTVREQKSKKKLKRDLRSKSMKQTDNNCTTTSNNKEERFITCGAIMALKIFMSMTTNKISQFVRECWNMRNTKYEILLYLNEHAVCAQNQHIIM